MSRKVKKGRDVNGIVLLNKPLGMSSNIAVQRVKRLFDARKAGHTGSLDPLATGLLPICLGEATKISGFLLDADKAYRAIAQLGVTTTTADAEGEILQQRPVDEFTEQILNGVLKQFIGPISQVPPMYSALKHEGQRLYKLARMGQEVERKSRQVTIREIQLLDFQADRFEIEVVCSKGTYIRTLVEDIGEALGCGAHVAALHRTQVLPFQSEKIVDIEQLEALAVEGLYALDACLQPTDTALLDWPLISVTDEMAQALQQGQAISPANGEFTVPDIDDLPGEGLLRLYLGEKTGQTFLGIGRLLEDGRITPKRLIFG